MSQKKEQVWCPITMVPSRGKFDILAKRWNLEEDKFEFRRFTDCIRNHDARGNAFGWTHVEPSWLPVAYMVLPPIPDHFP